MKTVVLDPGHGGHDPGAVGPNGTRESERALDVCRRAAVLLRPYVRPVLTRRNDHTFLELHERPAVANAEGADAFVSYHFNSGSSPNTALSFEGFTTRGQNRSDKLAECVLVAHGRLCPWQRLRADRSDGDDDKEANFAVLRPTRCPSMLMEGEFIHTTGGEASILNPDHQQLRALAVALGVLDFLEIEHDLAPSDPLAPSPDIDPKVVRTIADAMADEVGKLRGLLP